MDLPNSHPIAGSNEDEDGDAFAQYEREQQLEIMRQQDEQVEDVTRTVGVLQAQAADMGRELEDQTEMLEETNALAIRVEGKLQGGIKRVGHIIKRNEGLSHEEIVRAIASRIKLTYGIFLFQRLPQVAALGS